MKDRRRLAILLSGRGSNFEAIADSVDRGSIPDAEIAPVISDVLGSRGVARKNETALLEGEGPEVARDRQRPPRREAGRRARAGVIVRAKGLWRRALTAGGPDLPAVTDSRLA